jgi:hypothetical protein
MLITLDNRQVHITEGQFDAMEMLKLAGNGGFASAIGYKPTTDYVVIPTVNLQFISKFSTVRLYDRRDAALAAVAFNDLDLSEPKLAALSKADALAQFTECMAKMVASHRATRNGEREDAHRQGYDRNHIPVCNGVVLHLVTEKGADGLKHPVLAADGNPTVDCIRLYALVIGRVETVKGEKKKVNSGCKVLMDKAIEKAWANKMDEKHGKKHGKLSMISLSLRSDNHDHIKIGGEVLDAELYEAAKDYIAD